MAKPENYFDKYVADEWRLNGNLHRTDGPAVIWPNGTREWFINGQHHRTDGPAIVRSDGTEYWYLNDHLHREDGPAIIWSNGTIEWYLRHNRCTFNEWLIAIDVSDEERTWLKLMWG